MAAQASKKCGLLLPDHQQIGSCTSNSINSEQIPVNFSMLTISLLAPQSSAQSGKRFLTPFILLSQSPSYRLLREQRQQFGTGSRHLFHTHDFIARATNISIKREKVPGAIFMFEKNTLRGSRQMASYSTPLSIQRPLSSPCTARVITTVILAVVLSGILSACIRVHIDLATNNGTAVPRATPPESDPPEPVPDEKNLNGDTAIQCDLKSQVPNARQQTGSWCWAASSQLVVEYLNKPPTPQCELVSQTFEKALRESTGQLTGPFLGCCEYLDGNPDASNLGGTCDQGGWPEWILDKQGIAYTKYESSVGQRLDWAGLTKQICDDHPFIFVVQWSGGGRHSAVGGGYHKTEHFGNFVEVYDHSPSGFYAMPYQEYLGHKGGFRHEFGYIDIHLQ